MPNPIQLGNDQNRPDAKSPKGSSTFDNLTQLRFMSLRFGDITPFMFFESLKTDKIPFRSDHDLRTLSLQSPLMSDLKLHKHFFNVPIESILPLNWEQIYTLPISGDDTPADAYTSVGLEQLNKIPSLFTSWVLALSNSSISDTAFAVGLLRGLVFFEYFYSYGSLLSYCGIKFSSTYEHHMPNGINYSYDEVFDQLITAFSDAVTEFSVIQSGTTPRFNVRSDFNPDYPYTGKKVVSYHTMLESLRDELFFTSVSLVDYDAVKFKNLRDGFKNLFFTSNNTQNFVVHPLVKPLDFIRLWAYQIVCAHFFTDDHVDYIYSADLFRQLISSYIYEVDPTYSSVTQTFTYNGINKPYDYCSAHYTNYMFDELGDNIMNASPAVLGYFSTLLSFKRSLKYKDYFVGARTQPLAVGSNDIPVNAGDSVSVLDVTRSLQAQRFRNAVNRFGRKFSSYLEGLLGGRDVAYDYHNPAYIADTSEQVGNYETQNTGDSQLSDPQSITSNIRSASGKYCFSFDSDRPSILVGVLFFDVRRCYSDATYRLAFVKDRFDMFNPFMQYIGDQEIYGAERNLADSSTFGYTLRNMEYKQLFDDLSGAFAHHLPSFCFRAYDASNPFGLHLSPDFIRSKNAELDPYYISLSGYSLASYFHFYAAFVNDFSGSRRPMVYAPTIL